MAARSQNSRLPLPKHWPSRVRSATLHAIALVHFSLTSARAIAANSWNTVERLAILELRAARGWSQAQTARRLLVTPLTVASWSKRLDDEGPSALVQVREPNLQGPVDLTSPTTSAFSAASFAGAFHQEGLEPPPRL